MKNTKFLVGIFAALILVAGGLYGVQQINAGENCASHTTATATVDKADAKVETANATSTTSAGCCAAKAGTVNAEHASATGTCATKTGTVNAEHASTGAQCTYNAKAAGVQCTTGDKAKADGELMTAEATMAKLSHCGIDCRTVDAQLLATKLATSQCGTYTQEQWTSMIKSAQALDAKQSDAIFASATSEKPCAGDACPMKKVAADMAAAQSEEKKASSN